MGISKALQSALHKRGITYNCGVHQQTSFHVFHPARAEIGTVLFHGTGNDALFGWEDLILDLLRSGRAVFTCDLPGHGQNSHTLLNESLFFGFPASLPALWEVELPKIQRFEAIAYSLGGVAALQIPRFWERLVLIALPERVQLSAAFAWHEARSILQSDFWWQVATYGLDARFPAFGPLRRARFPIRLSRDIRVSYPRFVEQLLQKNASASQLKELKNAALLIYGSRDVLAPAAYGRSLPGDFRLVQGANHFMLPLLRETRQILINWLTDPPIPAANSVPR